MARKNLNKIQERYDGSALCPDHAEYFEMPKGSYVPAPDPREQDPQDPVECECCALAIMRAAGVV